MRIRPDCCLRIFQPLVLTKMNLEPFTYSKKWIGITFFRLPLTVADIYLHYNIFCHYHSTIMHLSWFLHVGLFIWLIMGCLHLYKPKWSSIKRDRFCVKTTLFAGQDAKTRHKNTPSMADKHPRIPVKTSHRPGSAPLPHPGLHDGYTRVSSGFASCFWQKKSRSWWKMKLF